MGDLVPIRRRRSAVEAFGCPYRYQKIYLEGVEDAGDEALRGRAFHVVALVYIHRLVAAGTASDHQEAVAAFVEGMALIRVPDHLREEVERLFFRWAERFDLNVDAFLQAEELVAQDDREFRPDLVYAHPGELEIYDFKTFFKGLTEIQARKELQPRWYLVEAKRAWPGFKRYRFTWDFVRLGWKLSIVFTADEVDELAPGVQTAIDQVAQAEATGDFEPLPGSHCGLCRLNCPAVSDALDLDRGLVPMRVTSPDQAVKVGGHVLVLERRLKLLKKALGAYCSLEGPVTVGGEQFAHTASLSARYPAVDAIAILDAHDLNTERVTLSKSGLALGKKLTGKVWDDLAAIAVESRRSQFRHKRVGEDAPKGAVDILDEGETDGPDYDAD